MGSLYFGIALKGTAVLMAAWLMALALRRRSAASRHLVWTACAAALVALPILSLALPQWRVAAGPLLAMTPSITFRANSTATEQHAGAPGPASQSAASQPVKTSSALPLRDPGTILLFLWAAGTAAVLGQMAISYLRMHRTRRTSPPYPSPEICQTMAGWLGIRQAVGVKELPAGSMPVTFGIWRSTLFLPADAQSWSGERRRVVVLHELAHVLRGDAATHVLARVALAPFWWNPLAWSAWRQLLRESERAADDLVLTAGEPPTEYAGHLLDVARHMQSQSNSLCVTVAMARRSELEGRLLAILDSRVNRRAPRSAWAWAAAFTAMALVAPVAAIRAQETKQPVIAPEVQSAIQAATDQKDPAILDKAAKAYETQHKYDAAKQLLESALAIREDRSGRQSAAYQAGLLKLGDLAAKRGPQADAVDFYTRAIAIGETPETAGALVYLGTRALNKENAAPAQNFLQRALNVDPSGPQAGRALTWMGHLSEILGLAGVAESQYLQALAVDKPNSADAAFTMEMYARLLSDQSRTGEAASMHSRAAVIHEARVAELSPPLKELAAAQRVGNGTVAPKLLSKIEPDYSEEARVAKLQGTVVLKVTIGTDGRAGNISLTHSQGFGLDEKAVEAVQQWQFQPGTKDGMPVPVVAQVEVNFRLL
jgi:TonB family protein